jgi:hypothetical protein
MLLGRAFPSYAALHDSRRPSMSRQRSNCWRGAPLEGGEPRVAVAPRSQHLAGSEGHGGGKGEIAASSVGTALIPPPLSVNHSDQSAMIGVVARHPDAYAPKSSTFGFPS